MANNNSALEQLKSFLNELFQFDTQDLDFGVYKILHYKRKEIKDFIDKLLVDKVREQLQTLTTEEGKKATEQLKELEQDAFIQGWINANEEERKIAEKLGKKKFVLSTEWVITIDRLVEYIGEEEAKPIMEEVIKNEKQVAEWKELFGVENVPKNLSLDTLKADLHRWRKLPIDTVHFSHEFKID